MALITKRQSIDTYSRSRAKQLKLHGLLSHWEEIEPSNWVEPLIQWEEEERVRRGLERRIKGARLGRFKLLADFDWSWPKQWTAGDLLQLGTKLIQDFSLPPLDRQ